MKSLSRNKNKISATKFDEMFDRGEDVTPFLDLDSVQINRPHRRINLDIPVNVLNQIDFEANRIGVARTALIKIWLAEKVDHSAAHSQAIH